MINFEDLNVNYFSKSPRSRVNQLSIKDRDSNFKEVSTGLSRDAALAEAERCFHCGNCNVCENCFIFCPDIAIAWDDEVYAYTIDRNLCKSCGICIRECPRDVITWEDGS